MLADRDERVGPTPWQLLRDAYERVDPARTGDQKSSTLVYRKLTGTPLDRLYHGKALTRRQWEAGDRLREDYYRAGLEASITGSYDAPVSGSGHPAWLTPVSQGAAEARMRWRDAVQAVGKRLGAVLISVVCFEVAARQIGASDHGRAGQKASIAGVTALQLALDSLADHYRIPLDKGDRLNHDSR